MPPSEALQNDQQKFASIEFVPQRTVKKAPSTNQEKLKERRRALFLNKVKEGREERRFEVRADDVSAKILIWRMLVEDSFADLGRSCALTLCKDSDNGRRSLRAKHPHS